MNRVRKQTVRNTYNIIYNTSIYDVYNTNNLQKSIRSRIEQHKTVNLLHELDKNLVDWKINETETETETESKETCPVCYESIQSNNYIVPKCGHKLCLDCYKRCILSQGDCANKCCLCRQAIL